MNARPCRPWTHAALLIAFVMPAAAHAEIPQGAAHFAGELLQKHRYLLSGKQRKTVDDLNRRIREAGEEAGRAKDDAAKAAAVAKGEKAVGELIDLIGSLDATWKLSIESGKATPPLEKPFKFPGDVGAAILRIRAGDGPTRFTTIDVDQSQNSWDVDVSCAPTGTTWALVGLNHVPAERTSFTVKFKRQGMDDVKTLMDVVTPESGRLKVTILSDDTGKPAPAMVSLVWKTRGIDRKPSTAIEFAPQFDNQGHASGKRKPNLPGPLGRWFWCVPEPFDMVLPPGKYEIVIARGVEHMPVFETITLEPGGRVNKTYRPRRWVDMRNLGWYSGDDHVHCQILSDDDAERLMAWVQAEDIHVANVVKMGDIYRTWFEQRGWGPAYRVIDGDYVLSPGQECPRTHDQIGHTLSMKTTSMVRDTDKYYLYDWVADTVHEQGGLWGYAHVNSGAFNVHRDMSINIPKGKCDFAEVHQFNRLGTDLWYEFLNAGFKVTASCGSDVPWGGSIGEVRLYAYVGDKPFSTDGWFEAVRRGRTIVTSGPMLQFQVNNALPGDEINVKNRGEKLTIKARAWGHPNRLMPTRLEIVRHGEVVHKVEPAREGQAELKAELELEAGDGSWIAARAYANDGTAAHTTPVYVIRKPLRFWKYAVVDDLLAKRRESLNQIEQIVAEAQMKSEAGELPGDRTLQQLAAQGPALLERVADARKIYDDLEQIAKDEADLRSGGQ